MSEVRAKKKMSELKNLIVGCVSLAANLSPTRINAAEYLSRLTEVTSDNYNIFREFACASSNSMLAILYKLRHFGSDRELLNIAAEIILARAAFEHEEEDVGGHVAFLMANYHQQSAGTYFITYSK